MAIGEEEEEREALAKSMIAQFEQAEQQRVPRREAPAVPVVEVVAEPVRNMRAWVWVAAVVLVCALGVAALMLS